MALSYNTTWLGMLGGGVSGAIVAGGSIYQIDLWNMGGKALPVRVMVKGTRIGPVAHTGTAIAALIVKECATAQEMNGLEDTGLDWEFAVGLSGKDIVKTGATLFKTVANAAADQVSDWAKNETAKRFVNWVADDLSIVEPGKAFHLIPYPLQFGIGAGIFYEWQTLSVLGGKTGWKHIKPTWSVSNDGGGVMLQMWNIPEQDGEKVRIGFSVPEWGIDPYICWKKEKGNGKVGESSYHIEGYVYGGYLYDSMESWTSGINISNFAPTGRLEEGIFSGFTKTNTVQTSGKLTVQPCVFHFGNKTYWSASSTMTVDVDSKGRFTKVDGGGGERS